MNHHSRYIILNKNKKPRIILIYGARFLLSCDEKRNIKILENYSILVKDGIIKKIFKTPNLKIKGIHTQGLSNLSQIKKLGANFKADLIYNASLRSGLVITPGFINTHSHPPMYLLRSSMMLEKGEELKIDLALKSMACLERAMSDKALAVSALGDFTEEQKFGITTTFSHYGVFDPIDQAAEQCGQRVINAVSAASNTHPENTPQLVEKYLKNQDKYFSKPAVAIHTLFKAPEIILKQVKKLAQKYPGTLLTLHFAESSFYGRKCQKVHKLSELQLLKKHKLLDEQLICSHAVHLTHSEVKELVKHKAGIAHLPTSNLIHKSGRFKIEHWAENNGLKHISLGTDSVVSKNNLDLLTEALQTRTTHNAKYTVSYEDLFAMMTINAAQILHLDQAGCILPGYRADLCFWKLKDRGFVPYDEYDPRTLIGNMITHGGRTVRDLMVDGQFIISDRKHQLVDESKLLGELQEEHMRLRVLNSKS